MDPILKKLQFKEGFIFIEGCPSNLHSLVAQWPVLSSKQSHKAISFYIGFVYEISDIENRVLKALSILRPDALLWLCYPKKSSKNYKTDIHRDIDWYPLGNYGFEPVRLVAIDEDWSAMRFRHTDFIKTMNRNPNMRIS